MSDSYQDRVQPRAQSPPYKDFGVHSTIAKNPSQADCALQHGTQEGVKGALTTHTTLVDNPAIVAFQYIKVVR